MAHGGIRYLERGQVRLVRESVLERDRLLRNAPHLVTPIPVTIPTDSLWRGVLAAPMQFLGLYKRETAPGLVILAIGLALYDWLGRRGRTVPAWGLSFRRSAQRKIPGLASRYCGLGWIWDGRIRHPERITVELLEDG